MTTPLLLSYKWWTRKYRIDNQGKMVMDEINLTMHGYSEHLIENLTVAHLCDYKRFTITDLAGQYVLSVQSGDWGERELEQTGAGRGDLAGMLELPKIRDELAAYERHDTSKPWDNPTLKWKSDELRWQSSTGRGKWLRHVYDF